MSRYQSISPVSNVDEPYYYADPLAPVQIQRRKRHPTSSQWTAAILVVVAFIAVTATLDRRFSSHPSINNMGPGKNHNSTAFANNSTNHAAPRTDVDGIIDRWERWKHLAIVAWYEMSVSRQGNLRSAPTAVRSVGTNANIPPDASWNLTAIQMHLGHSSSRRLTVTTDNDTQLIFMNGSKATDILVDNSKDEETGEDYSKDYYMLNLGLDTQINQAYCAVATTAAVLNSFKERLELPVDPVYAPYRYATQSDVLNPCTNQNVVVVNSTFDGILAPPGGLVLSQMQRLLECNLVASTTKNWSVDVVHLDPSKVTIDQFRNDIKNGLLNPNQRAMVNLDRAAVGEVGGGHFSPIGSYSPDQDAFLLMDVSKYKYPEAWIPVDLLYKSLSTFDPCGKWDYPGAQSRLPPKAQFTESQSQYLDAMETVGCKPDYRGYVIVTVD